MNRGAASVAVLVACLVAVAWVTTASPTPLLHRPQASQGPSEPASSSAPPDGQQSPAPPRDYPEERRLSRAADLYLYIILVLFALALLPVVWVGWRRSRGRAVLPAQETVAPLPNDDDVEVARTVAESARSGVDRLAEGSARNAIVRCWLELEDAVATAGVPQSPAQTSTELTERVLARLLVDDTAIVMLADLYREARFSEHQLTEDHRRRAVAALRRLLADLPAGTSTEQTTVPTGDPGSA